MSLSNQIIYGDVNTVASMLNVIKDLDYTDEYGYTPLIQTAIVNNEEMAKLLLDKGADVNFPDLTGRTALHWAVDNDNMDFVKVLLEHKANPNVYTVASQPVLSKPILRNQSEMKYLLMRFGGDAAFANDYINTKLLGHRFELRGYVDIVDANTKFTELSYEGFVLEFTLDVIKSSLTNFKSNYASRHLEHDFHLIETVIDALDRGIALCKFQNYLVDIKEKRKEVSYLLSQNLLIIPIGQEGHAITIVRYQSLVAICDRAEQDDPNVPTVQVFYMNRPSRLNVDLVVPLIYQRQTLEHVKSVLQSELSLAPIGQLDLPLQLMGNCSWANVEACLPVLILLLGMQQASDQESIAVYRRKALLIYRQWREWDKERALQFCMRNFENVEKARQASKATILTAIFVQSCRASYAPDVDRARRIFPFIIRPEFDYILQSYLQVYRKNKESTIGKNLRKLIRLCDDYGEMD